MTLRILAICFSCLFSIAAEAAEMGMAHRVIWRRSTSEAILAQGLRVFRTGDLRQSSRMLIVTPTGRRMVLSHTLGADGLARVTLLDETTEWHAALHWDYRVSKAALWDVFRALDIETVPIDKTIRMSVEVADKRSAVTDVPFKAYSRDYEEFFDRLRDRGAVPDLRAAIPAELQPELAFLDAALTDRAEGLQFRPLVEFLRRLIPDAEEAPSDLIAKRGHMVRGMVLTDADQISFALPFRSVLPTDPLVDQ